MQALAMSGVKYARQSGYIPRSRKRVGYAELAQASRDVYDFGDDNVSILLVDGDVLASTPSTNTTSPFKHRSLGSHRLVGGYGLQPLHCAFTDC